MSEEGPVLCIPADCRAIGFCMASVRPWFAQNGLDYRVFARDGILSSELEATGDDNALKVVAAARRRLARGR